MTHASLFSGIGAAEIAASMLGWDNLFHCEINPFCKQILDYWYPDSISYEDVTKTDFKQWQGKVDVLTGGFPCQPFSIAGKRKGAKDDRFLWPSMLKAIHQIRPTWIIAENVAGILTMAQQSKVIGMESTSDLFAENNNVRRKFQLRQSFTMQRICTDIESCGYAVQPLLIPACAVGAPHRRDRLFIVARKITSDTDSMGRKQQRSKTLEEWQDNIQTQVRSAFERLSEELITLYANSDRLQRGIHPDGNQKKLWPKAFTKKYADRFKSQRTWEDFPVIPPVCRRDDGLPFDVDNLTISFNRWRTESIKAYGNAIVPQVLYEIFRFIEIVENYK